MPTLSAPRRNRNRCPRRPPPGNTARAVRQPLNGKSKRLQSAGHAIYARQGTAKRSRLHPEELGQVHISLAG